MNRRDIELESDGVTCRGSMYLPDAGPSLPALVMAHALSGVKEMDLPAFAERFASAGFAVLLFDYRFGHDGYAPWLARRGVARRTAPTRARSTRSANALRSVVWAAARSTTTIARSTIATGDGYGLAATAAIVAAEWTRRARRPGAFTPAGAFSAHYVLSTPGATRFDQPSERA